MSNLIEVDVAVIGAGFSGIATAAALRRYGVENTVLLERGSRYGQFWAENYDRITLHTPWHDLPADDGLSDNYAMFKSRLELLDYFDKYAALHHLAQITRFGTSIEKISRIESTHDHPWKVTSNGDSFLARYVVVATGFCRVPTIPDIPGLEAFEGTFIHSKSYRNAKPFVGKRTLVVGSGNSACEIAIDLVENDAASVDLLVHGGRYMIPIGSFAEVLQEAREAGMAGPEGVLAVHPITPGSPEYFEAIEANDELLRPIAEDMVDYGIPTPDTGPAFDLIVNNRVPVLDHGAIPLIRSGDIGVIRDRIVGFDKHGPHLRDTGLHECDVVIFATGFKPGLEDMFVEDVTELREESNLRMPRTDRRCRSTEHPTLFFAGFDHTLWGGLSHGTWGFEIAERISTEMGRFDPDARPESFGHSPWLQS